MSHARPEHESWGDRLLRWTYLLIAAIHLGAARALSFLGKWVGAMLARLPWSVRFGLQATLLASAALFFFPHGQDSLYQAAAFSADSLRILQKNGLTRSFDTYANIALDLGILLSAAALLAFLRRKFVFLLLRILASACAVYWFYFMVFAVNIPSALFAANEKTFDKFQRNDLWVSGFLLWLLPALVITVFLISLSRRSAKEFYWGVPQPKPLLGDRLVVNLKYHGGDPLYRTSFYWATFLHVFVFFILPVLILGSCRMEKPYGIPLGKGEPVVRLIIKKPVKKKPKMLYVLNMNSPIIFYRPDIDESKIIEDLKEETTDQYVATALPDGSGLGKGGKGKGGWPHGMAGAKVRFIRLEYEGGDWDQDMGVGADYNLLLQFHELTTFKIWDQTESVPIRQLRRFPKDRGPPFVFITGSRGINVSSAEVKTLRWYCLDEGGMIFADNGGGHFDSSFRQLMRRVFPDLEWVDIANDDILFRQPFLFPNGAPPLWHHSGNRAMGLKYNGRWVVFYHQGDVNDAWKTGHSGATKFLASQSYKLGVNIVNYSFNRYMEIHFKE